MYTTNPIRIFSKFGRRNSTVTDDDGRWPMRRLLSLPSRESLEAFLYMFPSSAGRELGQRKLYNTFLTSAQHVLLQALLYIFILLCGLSSYTHTHSWCEDVQCFLFAISHTIRVPQIPCIAPIGRGGSVDIFQRDGFREKRLKLQTAETAEWTKWRNERQQRLRELYTVAESHRDMASYWEEGNKRSQWVDSEGRLSIRSPGSNGDRLPSRFFSFIIYFRHVTLLSRCPAAIITSRVLTSERGSSPFPRILFR